MALQARRQNTSIHINPQVRLAKPSPGPAFLVKAYLVTYNVLSTIGWAYILHITITHLFNLQNSANTFAAAAHQATASATLSRFLASVPLLKSHVVTHGFESYIPAYFFPLYQRSTTTFARVGLQTALVQSFAILEVLHTLIGWVRSPVTMTVIQVSSRLFMVWAISEQYREVRTNPFYALMVLAWATTEVIRYSFYAFNLIGSVPYVLLYLRYTTFYVLYPLGAGSEAFLIFTTLSTPPSNAYDSLRTILFLSWLPGLVMMFIYMMAQRKKVLGEGENAYVSKRFK